MLTIRPASTTHATPSTHVPSTAAADPATGHRGAAFDAAARPQASGAQAATDAAAPPLPDPEGPRSTPAAVARTLAASGGFLDGGDSFYAMLQVFAEAHQQTAQMAHRLKILRSLAQMHAKYDELDAEGRKIVGERQSIVWRTLVSGISTLTSLSTGIIGAQIEWRATQGVSRSNLGWGVAAGSALKNSAGAIGQFVSVGGDALDRAGWPQGKGRYAADEASLAQRAHGTDAQLAQNDVESANSLLEHMREQRKSALSAMMAAVQMWGEAINQRASALS